MRELILQAKNPDKIQQQIDEISKLEAVGEAEKRHKVKKKQLEDTLTKVKEKQKAEKEKGGPHVSVDLHALGVSDSSSYV